jgi:excisionase family DNA binding protein
MEEVTGYYLTVAEFALQTKISERSIRRWITDGKIKAVKFGDLIRIPKSELIREDLPKG